MNSTKKMLILFSLLTVLFLWGCETAERNDAGPDDTVPAAAAAEEIIDYDELEYFWRSYVYHGIASIYNDDFADASAIEPSVMVQFVLFRMADEGLLEQAPDSREGSLRYVIPNQEDFTAQTVRYFGAEFDYDPALIGDRFAYDEETRSFPFHYSYEVHDAQPGAWGINLVKAVHDPAAGSYELTLFRYADREQQRVDKTYRISLRENEEGVPYVAGCLREYPETDFVQISGDYLELEPWSVSGKEEKGQWFVTGYGFGDSFLVSEQADVGTGEQFNFHVLNPRNGEVEASRSLESGVPFVGVRTTDSLIILKKEDSFLVLDSSLEDVAAGELPEDITVHDGFYGWDVKADGTAMVYANTEGLFLRSLETGSEKKLLDVLQNENSKFSSVSYILRPILTPAENMVVGVTSGYEGLSGLVAVNLASGNAYVQTGTVNGYSLNGGNAANIFPEMVYENGGLKLKVLDFSELTEDNNLSYPLHEIFSDNEIFRDGPEPMTEFNEKYMAWVSSDIYDIYDRNGKAEEAVWKIMLTDLETMETAELGSIKAGRPQLLAITGGGDVLVRYNFEREEGLVVFHNKQ